MNPTVEPARRRRRPGTTRAAVAALAVLAGAGGFLAARSPSVAMAAGTNTFQCGILTVPMDSTVPGEIPVGGSQTNFNCFAWWEFISLNWPTDSGAGFGDPGDLAPVAWQTYMPLHLLYPPDGEAPPPWGSQPPVPARCTQAAKLAAGDEAPRVLSAVAKFATTPADVFDLPSSSAEAAPTNEPAWLGAQNGTNVWYEVRLNKAEYDYVVANKFYDANRQGAAVADGTPILLPVGTKDFVGTIELKAAWMEVTDLADPRWKRYKVAPAVVVDADDGSCRPVTVALVGLHIIHKTRSQPTWIWATFEHVDNAPDSTATPDSTRQYNFYSPSCKPRQVTVSSAQCLAPGATSPVTVGCTANVSPPYYLGKGCPGPVPIQVTRRNPIDEEAADVNQTAQQAIAQAYPGSVWQYYQLVDVIWSSSPVAQPTAPVKKPMPLSSMQPTGIVANTTLETYAQNLTCTDCHRFASIAPTAADTAPVWAADFSFSIGAAKARAKAVTAAAEPSRGAPHRTR